MALRARLCAWARQAAAGLKRWVDDRCTERQAPVHSNFQYGHSAQLLLYANAARRRAHVAGVTQKALGSRLIWSDDVVATILLSAASAEAFINEFAEIVGIARQAWDKGNPAVTPNLSVAADVIFALEDKRRPTLSKYVAGAKALGRAFDRGSTQFLALRQLFDLRNAIMHLKPPRAIGGHSGADIAKKLVEQGLAVAANASWFDVIQSPPVADWAYRAARSAALHVLEAAPHGPGSLFGMQYDHWRNTPP